MLTIEALGHIPYTESKKSYCTFKSCTVWLFVLSFQQEQNWFFNKFLFRIMEPRVCILQSHFPLELPVRTLFMPATHSAQRNSKRDEMFFISPDESHVARILLHFVGMTILAVFVFEVSLVDLFFTPVMQLGAIISYMAQGLVAFTCLTRYF